MDELNEDYCCVYCDRFWTFPDLKSKWRCSICGEYVYIKKTVSNFDYAINRVTIDALKKDDGVILPGDTIHYVLNIEKNAKMFRVALKNYGVLKCDSEKEFNKIIGGWHLTK